MIFLMGFFVEQFLDYLQFQRKYSNHTCVAYKNDLEEFQKFLADRFEINSFNGVSSDMVRSWVSELIGQNIKPVTVRRKVSTLRTYFKFLQKEKRIDRSPVSNLPALKIASQLPVTIPLESMDTILEELPAENSYQQHLDYLIIALLYGTGCRRSEIIGLQEQNIDLVGRQIKVLGKRNKERIIPITTELNDQIAIFIEIKAGEGIVSERLLVTKKKPNIISRIYLQCG
jgi:integrase/recombinase XerC